MAPPLLHLDSIILKWGAQTLLDGASLSIREGARMALVGRNGCGKSTLLKIAAGLLEPTDGYVFRAPQARVCYLPQAPDLAGFSDIDSYVKAGLGPSDDPHRAKTLLAALDLDGAAVPSSLSGGQVRRAALARVLGAKPDVLLLDEPTNHLDLQAIEWLEGELARWRGAMVLISHDRRFLETMSQSTVWLDRGVTRCLEQGFGAFEAWRDKILEEEERNQRCLARQIAREEHWLRYGVTARRKPNVRRLGALQGLRQKYRNHQGPQGQLNLQASESQASSKLVVEARDIYKSFGGNSLVKAFSIRIERGERIGFVGPNGAGKTTLLSLLTGHLIPDQGQCKWGANLEVAVFDQNRSLDETQSLGAYLTEGRGDSLVINGQERHVTSYMKDFLFRPEQARSPIKDLSGGERARLVLARLLAQPANVLIVDEPTNDLDMESLDLLQELISQFHGTVLLVSHDRDFLDRTVTRIVCAEGGGVWQVYAGGYKDMLVQRKGARAAYTDARIGQKVGVKKTPSPTPSSAVGRQKLSYKQVYRLEKLPHEIEELNGEIAKLEAILADPALYTQDAQRFYFVSKQLDEARATLLLREEEWLELEMLREAIGGV